MFDEAQELDLILKAASEEEEEDEEGGEEEEGDDEERDMRGDGDEDEDDEGEGYNASYMKKHMKRYCKENRGEMAKFMKDLGMVKKAMTDSFDEGSDAMDEADATLFDGTDIITKAVDAISALADMVGGLKQEITDVKEVLFEQAIIAKASGSVLVKAAEILDAGAGVPAPRKSALAAPKERASGDVLKAARMNDIGSIKRTLLKAAQDGDQKASSIMTKVESCGGNLSLIGEDSLRYLQNIMAQ